MANVPVIQLKGLTVEFGKFIAVDQLDLDIHRGELFGLLGPNGAGKSTTLKVLIGQRRPSKGEVSILGHDIVRDWALIKPKFGYVPDKENHFDEFTGRHELRVEGQVELPEHLAKAARASRSKRMTDSRFASDSGSRNLSATRSSSWR